MQVEVLLAYARMGQVDDAVRGGGPNAGQGGDGPTGLVPDGLRSIDPGGRAGGRGGQAPGPGVRGADEAGGRRLAGPGRLADRPGPGRGPQGQAVRRAAPAPSGHEAGAGRLSWEFDGPSARGSMMRDAFQQL